MEVNTLTSWNSVFGDLSSAAVNPSQLVRRTRVPPDGLPTSPALSPSTSSSTPRDDDEILDPPKPRPSRLLRLALFFLRRFAKGFAVGFIGKFILNLFRIVLKTRGNVSKLPSILASRGFPVLWVDPSYHGLFLGSFLGVFECVLRYLSSSNRAAVRQLSAPVAASLGSMAICIVPRSTRSTVAMFFLVRALEILVKSSVEYGVVPSLPVPYAILMIASSMKVLHAWFFDRSSLDSGYAKFLDFQGGKGFEKSAVIGRLVELGRFGPLKELTPLEDFLRFAHETKSGINKEFLLQTIVEMRRAITPNQIHAAFCRFLHPETPSCTIHWLMFIKEAMRRALPVYLPVFIIPMVLFRPSKLFRSPIKTIAHLLFGIGRSSFFLSLYCASAWYLLCNSRWFLNSDRLGNASIYFTGLSGLSVLIEKDTRRIELALYVASQALRSILKSQFHHLHHHLAAAEIFAFCFSMVVILTSYVELPSLIRPSYYHLLKYFFGSSHKTMKHDKDELDSRKRKMF